MISEDKKVKLELVQISGIVNLLMEKCDHSLLELRVNKLEILRKHYRDFLEKI